MLSPGEFVVNAEQTAKHKELLYAINSGSYASASFGGGGGRMGGGAGVTNNFNVDVKPIRDNDPYTTATVMGREFARRAAG